MTKPCALYRCFSEDHRLLYVGCSPSPLTRLKSHEKLQPWATDIRSVTVEWFPDRNAAMEAEKMAISAELPEWNVHHRPNPQHSIGTRDPDFRRNDPSTWTKSRTPFRPATLGGVPVLSWDHPPAHGPAPQSKQGAAG